MKVPFKNTRPEFLFVCGLLIMMAFIFQSALTIRAVQTVFFIILSILMGKRFRLLPNLIMILGVLLMHVITPRGQVLFYIGSWALTLGSLVQGLYKGLLLVGLIYISRVFVSRNLRFPGTVGQLLGGTFSYFELITENKGDFNPRKPLVSLDAMLMKLDGAAGDPLAAGPAGAAGVAGAAAGGKTVRFGTWVFPILLVLVNFLLLFLPAFVPLI